MGAYVIIYSILLLLCFVFYLHKKQTFDIGALLLLVWFTASLFSIYIYFNIPFYGFPEVKLIPYLYLYGVLILSFVPFFVFNEKKINSVVANKPIVYYISVGLIILSILPFIENLRHLFDVVIKGNNQHYVDIYETRVASEEVRTWFSYFGRRMNTICLLSFLINPILLFYWLVQEKKEKVIIMGLVLSIVNVGLYSLLVATRVSLFSQIIFLVYLYFLFRGQLEEREKRKIKLIGSYVFVFLMILLIVISISRFNVMNNNISIFEWFAIYFGESTIRFNAKMWNTEAYMMGDNSFSYFKEIMGLKTYVDISDRRYYWAIPTGIEQNVFYTFIGDFFGDFGPYYAIIIVVLFVIMVYPKNNKNHQLHDIILFSVWYYICIFGFMYFPFTTYFGNKTLVFNILFYFILKITANKRFV